MDSDRNNSPLTSVNPALQERKRVRYVLPQGALIGGLYEVVKPLGHGGMGEVYLARHTKLDIFRAVKILLPKIAAAKPEFANQFMQEARLAIQIQHPNIINVMDANHDEKLNIYYIVMELVDGSSIKTLIKKNGPFGEQEALGIALDVGRALEEADRKKIVHRDIKPDNIMLTRENKVKLADLGIAKSPADDNLNSLQSQNVLIGTPAYVSPEQVQNAQTVDCRADIYSLGVSLYEMLTGEKPYKGASTREIVEQLFSSPVPDVRKKNPRVSAEAAKLIMKMMAKDKEDRPRNWTVLCRSLDAILGKSSAMPYSGSDAAVGAAAGQPGGGIVMTDNRSLPEALPPELKKTMRRAIPAVIGFAICLLLIGGLVFGRHFRRGFVLMCMGSSYRIECDKYHLDPPWEMAFASTLEKDAWLNQNKPKPPKERVLPSIKTEDKEDLTPKGDKEYTGDARVVFKLDVTPAVEDYIFKVGAKLNIASGRNGGTISANFGEPVTLRAGRYKLHLDMDGFQKLPDVDLDAKHGDTVKIPITVQPANGKVILECNVEDFEVLQRDSWLKTRELQVPSLENQNVTVRAKGYRSSTLTVKLQPGEEKTLEIKLKPTRDTIDNTELMRQAEMEYRQKNYATAKKIYLKEAENDNRLANYRLGEIYENGYGEWISNKRQAYRHYRLAADQDYPPAIFKVGEFHENGLGDVTKNEAQALTWYRRGAELGSIPCLNRIAEYYENGRGGVRADISLAIEYYNRGAAQNDPVATYRLGLIYERQMESAGNQKDRDKFRQLAYQCYEKAGRLGDGEAKKRMKRL